MSYWSDENCNNTHEFICGKNKQPTTEVCTDPEPYGVKKNLNHWFIFFAVTAICQCVTSVVKSRLDRFYRWIPSADSELYEEFESSLDEDSDFIHF